MNILDDQKLLRSLTGKAFALYQRYQHSRHPEDLRLSTTTYTLAIQLIDRMKSSYKKEETKLFLAAHAETRQIYEDALCAGWELYYETQEDSLLHTLFSFSEKSKASVLREALRTSNARQFAGIPDSLLLDERDLRVDLNFYEARIREMELQQDSYDTTLLRDFQNRFFDRNRQYDTLLSTIETDYPDYYHLKYDTRVASVDAIRASLPPGHGGLIEYFVGDSILFRFHITKNELNVHAIDRPEDLEQLVQELREAMDYYFHEDDLLRSYRQYTRTAHRLYDLLLGDLPLQGSEEDPVPLIIIPDGLLSFIPFDILLYEQAPQVAYEDRRDINYRKLAYLLRRHPVSYHHSGTLLLQGLNKQRPALAREQCAAFTSEYPEEDNEKEQGTLSALRKGTKSTSADLATLWYAWDELKTIAHYLDGNYYAGDEGTETNFKVAAPDHKVLHLVMHGEADETNAFNSRLIFRAPKDPLDSPDDGWLHAYELYGLDLNADLVVLSACETGLGEHQQGEGIMSLGRGFLYAGASGVAQTLWSIPDRASSEVMGAFYGHLAAGMDKAAALRQAKLDFLSNTETRFRASPLYWGGFTLYGDMAPIELEKESSWWYWLLLIPVVVALVYILVYRRRFL